MSQHESQRQGHQGAPPRLDVSFGLSEQGFSVTASVSANKQTRQSAFDKILNILSQDSGPLSLLAKELLTSSPGECRALLNCPLKTSGLLPLFVAASLTWDRNTTSWEPTTKLSRDELRSLPKLMIDQGADPLMRDSQGRVPLLTDRLATDPIVLSDWVETQWPELALRLTRDEKIWLYCRAQLAFDNTRHAAVAERLLRNIFRGETDFKGHHNYRELRDILCDRAQLLPPDGRARATFLQSLETLIDIGALSKFHASHALDTSFDSEDELMIHSIVREKRRAEDLIPCLLRLGASLNIPSGIRSVVPGGLPIHIAAHAENLSKLFAKEPIDPSLLTKQDNNGNTPLHIYLAKSTCRSLLWIHRLSDGPMILSMLNHAGQRPLDIALTRDDAEVIRCMRKEGASVSPSPEAIAKINFIDSHDAFFRKASLGAQNGALRAFSQLSQSQRPLFLEAFSGIAGAQAFTSKRCPPPKKLLRSDAPETALTRCLPKAMLAPTPDILRHIALILDNEPLSGDSLLERDFHPHEAELLAMFAYAGSSSLERRDIQAMVLGLTSTRRFDRRGVADVLPSVVKLWAEIGSLGFEFLNLKYDARTFIDADGKKRTLLGAFGFSRSSSKDSWYSNAYKQVFRLTYGTPQSKNASWYITGSSIDASVREQRFKSQGGVERILHTLDPKTEVALYRTHMRIWHPEYAELIVRNSAPDGGRDSLLHPGYILGAAQRRRLLGAKAHKGLEHEWSFRDIERHFSEILDPKLYLNGGLGEELLHAKFLIEQYRTLMHSYRSWAFDLSPESGYVQDPITDERFLVGAYKSGGYKTVLQALRYWLQAGESLEAAVCRKHFPAWGEYCSIPITEATLEELEFLAAGDFSSPFLQDSGVFDFIQEGMFSFGDLIIRSTNRSTKRI